MGVRLKASFRAYVGGGGVLTFIGTAEGQAVYWSLDGIDPATGVLFEPYGMLWQTVTVTGQSRLATNYYEAPTHLPYKRYGVGFHYGEISYGQGSGLSDRVTAKAVLT